MSKLSRPFNNWTTYEGHGGIDYGQPRGAGVPASGPGVIDWSGYYSARGGWAKFIRYDCGCRHGYYHFDREQGLGVGARVDYGTIFAYVGGTGLYSTGPHLHHEVWNGTSSIIKPPAYWGYVDANSYVGDGSQAGAESTPLPITPPQEEEMKLIQANARGIAVVGPAYFKSLTGEELPIAVGQYGWPKDYGDNARAFDLDVSIHVNGSTADNDELKALSGSAAATIDALNRLAVPPKA